MLPEFFSNKRNLLIIGAVSLISIAFIIFSIWSDHGSEPAADHAAQETIAAATPSEFTATPADYHPVERKFSRPASVLKEIAAEDEEYIPAAYRLNLAYFYPEDADTSDAIHSYAGRIFQTLNTLNADYLANYYDMSDLTPLSYATRNGLGADRVMGKYNPQDSRHDPKNPSTWRINSFRNVNVTFYDGDGNRINGYYAVQEIMSLANVYCYYHDKDNPEAMEEYCRELFKSAMSSRVSMGGVYYDSGCLNRTKQDEAAEAIAMEAEQLATEHQLAGATAYSSGLTLPAIGESTGTAAENAESSSQGTETVSAAESTAAGQTVSSTTDGSVVVSYEKQPETTAASVMETATQETGGTVSEPVTSPAAASTAAPASETVVEPASMPVHEETSGSYAVYGGKDTLSGTYEAAGAQGAEEPVISDTAAASPAVSEEAGAAGSVPEAPPAEDSGYAEEPLVFVRKIFKGWKPGSFRPFSMSLFPSVFHMAEEDGVVVSPAAEPQPETAAPVAETAAPVAETQTQAADAVIFGTETAAADNTAGSALPQETEAAPAQDAVVSAPVSDGMQNLSSDSSYAVYNSVTGGYSVRGNGETIGASGTEESTTAVEELSEEEAAIAAQIEELLRQANVLSGAGSYCPGHVDLYITITIKGIDDRNGLFKADKIGNDPDNFNDRWQGWTTDKIAEAKALNHQDWFETYGLSISSINLTSQLTEEEIQHYLDTLPEDVSETRRAVVDFALHSVGKVPYYWGGKPEGPGYGPNHFYSLVGADYHGRILRGLDCSGWVNWVYWSATGESLAGQSTGSLIGCGRRIPRSALKPGDIIIRTGADAHVVMFLGWVGNGNFIGIHETGGVKNNVVVGEMTASWPYYRSLLD